MQVKIQNATYFSDYPAWILMWNCLCGQGFIFTGDRKGGSSEELPDSTKCVKSGADDVGPFYIDGAPVAHLEESNKTIELCTNSDQDDRLILIGTVRFITPEDPCGKPGRAMLDMWQANQTGKYSLISAEAHEIKLPPPGKVL